MTVADVSGKPVFDLKSTAWTLTALRLQVADLPTLAAALDARFGDTPGLFDHEPLVVDLGPLRADDAPVDWTGLLPVLRRHGMLPLAVQGGSEAQTAAALAAGLATAPPAVRHRPAADAVEAAPAEAPPAPGAGVPTLIVDRPLRSGQRVYARGGDLVITAVVSFGAEAIADGNIHVYAPLRGRAIAGARGDGRARIFSTCLEAQLVSIAGVYRTTETPLPANVLGRPAQVRLDGEQIILEALPA